MYGTTHGIGCSCARPLQPCYVSTHSWQPVIWCLRGRTDLLRGIRGTDGGHLHMPALCAPFRQLPPPGSSHLPQLAAVGQCEELPPRCTIWESEFAWHSWHLLCLQLPQTADLVAAAGVIQLFGLNGSVLHAIALLIRASDVHGRGCVALARPLPLFCNRPASA